MNVNNKLFKVQNSWVSYIYFEDPEIYCFRRAGSQAWRGRASIWKAECPLKTKNFGIGDGAPVYTLKDGGVFVSTTFGHIRLSQEVPLGILLTSKHGAWRNFVKKRLKKAKQG